MPREGESHPFSMGFSYVHTLLLRLLKKSRMHSPCVADHGLGSRCRREFTNLKLDGTQSN
jgi:hypothetical protein